ncbi:MAG: hypothetical protein R3C40_09050 [Parvularculaceae bacterium]
MLGNAREARLYRAELAQEMSPEEIAEAQRQAREYLAARAPRDLYGYFSRARA